MPTRQEIIDYITQAAEKRGIDPQVVLRVVQQESGFNPSAANDKGPKEKSYGLFQLNIQGGLGVHARERGIEPTDPSQWKQQVDFSLDTVKRDGWRQWGGAKDTGTGRWDGVLENKNPRSFQTASYMKPEGRLTVDIGDEPKLEQLTPYNSSSHIKNIQYKPSISQLAPTEADNTMARHPSYDQAIREAMAQVNSGNLKDQTQVAGLVLPNIRVKGKFQKNPMAEGVKRDRLPKPEDYPGPRTPTVAEQEKRAYEAELERKAQAARVQRGENPSPDQGSGPTINAGPPKPGSTDPIVPKRVPTNSYSPAGAATTGAVTTAAGAAAINAKNDPAVEAVQRQIQGPSADPPLDDTGGLGIAPQAVGPQPVNSPGNAAAAIAARRNPGSSVQSEMSPPAGNAIMQKVVPAMQEAVKDPQVRQAVKVVAGGVVKAAARKDALAADMANNPTYYQQRAAMARGGGGSPEDDRSMERAVMMDNERVMRGGVDPYGRGSSPRGVSPATQRQRPARQQQPAAQPNVQARPTASAQAPVKDQTQVPSAEEQIVQQVLANEGQVAAGGAQRFPPSGPPNPQQMAAGQSQRFAQRGREQMMADDQAVPPEMTRQSMTPQGDPNQMITGGGPMQGMMDPAMMALMSYFTHPGGE